MGFTAIWISPVVQQVTDPTRGYNGYSAQNIYGLNSNFGTASDLLALSTAVHNRGMVSNDLVFYEIITVSAVLKLNANIKVPHG